MILDVHGNLGDQVMFTGIPEAFYERFGEKTYISGEACRKELFETNPYLLDQPIGKKLSFGIQNKDHEIYYPVKIFRDISEQFTGAPWILDREKVAPNLYRTPVRRNANLVVVNDQAGWPSRTGYPYFNDLSVMLLKKGFTVNYLYNNNFHDCNGNVSQESIYDFSYRSGNESLSELIEKLSICFLYIGYESGIMHLAGALGTPCVYITGSVPSISAPDSCIFITKLDHCRKCHQENCPNMCLHSAHNQNDAICSAIDRLAWDVGR